MTDTGANDARVMVRRIIGAPRDRVFRSWTEPEQLQRWWGPGRFTCPEARVDLRAGGTYRLVMQPEEGPVMSVTGSYREVEPPSLLVYTWRWDSGPAASEHESVVTVTFDDLGDNRTQVTVIHDRFPPEHGAAPYRSGWEEGLEKLERAVLEGEERA